MADAGEGPIDWFTELYPHPSLLSPFPCRQALELGYRHFDCAEFYGNEAIVGQGLAGFVAAGKRDELFVVSKVWNTHHRPADVRYMFEHEGMGQGQSGLLGNSVTLIPSGTVSGGLPTLGRGLYLMHCTACAGPHPPFPALGPPVSRA